MEPEGELRVRERGYQQWSRKCRTNSGRGSVRRDAVTQRHQRTSRRSTSGQGVSVESEKFVTKFLSLHNDFLPSGWTLFRYTGASAAVTAQSSSGLRSSSCCLFQNPETFLLDFHCYPLSPATHPLPLSPLLNHNH